VDIGRATPVLNARTRPCIRLRSLHGTDTVRPPDQEESVFFGLPDNASVALIQLSRTAYAVEGEPIRFTVTVYPADRNMLFYNIGKVPDDHREVTGSA
jgi:GntR family transcriptional regulator